MSKALLLALFMAVIALQGASAEPKSVNIAPYANGNIQKILFPDFPTGRVIPPRNSFGVPFDIPARGDNFVVIDSNFNSPLTLPIGVPGVRKVYTLLQAYGPWPGRDICTVTFTGKSGAKQTFVLKAGADIRDFFESNFARTINNTTTRPAFECIGRGGAYTNDSSTGPRGFYNFDEQEFTLAPEFADQILESMTITATAGNGGTPILLGVTTETSDAPPASPVAATAPLPSPMPTPAPTESTNSDQPEAAPPADSLRGWLIAAAALLVIGTIVAIVAIRRWLNAP